MLPLDFVAVYPSAEGDGLACAAVHGEHRRDAGDESGSFVLRRRWPGLLAAWLSYLVILAPNLGIIRISEHIAADRYSYMSMLGWVVDGGRRFLPARADIVAGASWRHRGHRAWSGALLVLIPMTWDQCRTWRLEDLVDPCIDPRGRGEFCVAHYNLGDMSFLAAGSMGPRRRITSRRCGSIPAYPDDTTTWAVARPPGEV